MKNVIYSIGSNGLEPVKPSEFPLGTPILHSDRANNRLGFVVGGLEDMYIPVIWLDDEKHIHPASKDRLFCESVKRFAEDAARSNIPPMPADFIPDAIREAEKAQEVAQAKYEEEQEKIAIERAKQREEYQKNYGDSNLSSWALVARDMRNYLKEIGIKGRARSDSYAGGCSVHVTLVNPSPAVKSQVEKFGARYEQGSFNGMEDIYEMDNYREDVPQVKYLFVDSEFSPEIKQAAYDFLRGFWNTDDDLPEKYEDANNAQIAGERAQSMVYRVLSTEPDEGRSGYCMPAGFWEKWCVLTPKKKAVQAKRPGRKVVDSAAGHAHQIREGKRPGFVEVVFDKKPRETVRNLLKASGFRWSRVNCCWYGLEEKLPDSFK